MTEVATETPVSVFASQRGDVFTRYRAELSFHDKLMAGVPKDTKTIAAWLRSKAGIDDVPELRRMLIRTLEEMGVEAAADASLDDLIAASEEMAVQTGCGFKRDENGLFIESRQVKAMLKESTHILFAGTGKLERSRTKKSPKSFVAERVFVEPLRIYLGSDEPDGSDLVVGHPSGPKGTMSTLTYYEYVVGRTNAFDVIVTDDQVSPDEWAKLWIHAEANGLGALRSQGHGTFAVVSWGPYPS